MDVSSWLARLATRAVHVLVVEAPGAWSTRVAFERAAVQRGWSVADSPADADVLVVCGRPGPELGRAVDQVWEQLPGPRARIDLANWDGPQVLDDAVAMLNDGRHQQQDAQNRQGPELPSDMDHGDKDHGDMGHGDMGHGDMDMAPHGIPLAEGGDDRDGLEMDVLHVTLGPVLPHWPAGLVLRCALQGDVVTDAEARWVDADSHEGEGRSANHSEPARQPADRAARWCDDAAGLLALAGWERAAVQARSVRDELLTGGESASSEARLEVLQRKVAASRLLRWSLRGIGVVDAADARADGGGTVDPSGDVHDRLLAMLRNAQAELAGGRTSPSANGGRSTDVSLDHLTSHATGLDLAAVRLVVASLTPWLDRHEVMTHA